MNEDKTYSQELKTLLAEREREKNFNTVQQVWEETTETNTLGFGQS
jgi:hypothetical protein